jgi:hypothetical protein
MRPSMSFGSEIMFPMAQTETKHSGAAQAPKPPMATKAMMPRREDGVHHCRRFPQQVLTANIRVGRTQCFDLMPTASKLRCRAVETVNDIA